MRAADPCEEFGHMAYNLLDGKLALQLLSGRAEQLLTKL